MPIGTLVPPLPAGSNKMLISDSIPTRSGRIRSLHVRPLRSADLCFGIPGILEARPANVGDWVNGFSLQTEVLDRLTSTTSSADIRALMAGRFLATLRTPAAAAALDSAILQRTIAYLSRYKHKDTIVAGYDAAYSGPDNKIDRLNRLADLEETRANDVEAAYNKNPDLGGVILGADTSSVSYAKDQLTKTFIASLGSRTSTDPKSDVSQSNDQNSKPIYSLPVQWSHKDSEWSKITTEEPRFFSQQTCVTIPGQTVRTTFTDLRDMQKENQIRKETARIGLRSQILSETLPSAAAPEMGAILDAQLAALDKGIRVAQVAFTSLYLLPPFAGWVTNVFKEVGEAVAANEPVMRVEWPDEVLLVGLVRYRSRLSVKHPPTKVRIIVKEVFEDGGRVTLEGEIVAVRGHDSINDEWDIMIRANNKNLDVEMPDHTKRQIDLPLNYNFDGRSSEFEVLPD